MSGEFNVQVSERRKFKRYSAVPIKVRFKRSGEFKSSELIDISIGGLQIRTHFDFLMYDDYECQIEIPLQNDKDLIYAKAKVWRIEPDEENMDQKKRFVAFKFTEIEEYDQIVISEFLTSFEENVPYK